MTQYQIKELWKTLQKKAQEIGEIVNIPIEGMQRGEDFWESLGKAGVQGQEYFVQQKEQIASLPQIKPHIKTAEAAIELG